MVIFGSTSKITRAGAGISFLAASPDNLDHFKRHLGVQTIGPDKVNQLAHVRFLKDLQASTHTCDDMPNCCDLNSKPC